MPTSFALNVILALMLEEPEGLLDSSSNVFPLRWLTPSTPVIVNLLESYLSTAVAAKTDFPEYVNVTVVSLFTTQDELLMLPLTEAPYPV